MHRHFRLVSLC